MKQNITDAKNARKNIRSEQQLREHEENEIHGRAIRFPIGNISRSIND